MQIKSSYYLKDQYGKTRVVKKFLFRPRCFGGPYYKWLCFANIKEKVELVGIGDSDYGYKWVEVGFADDEPTKTPPDNIEDDFDDDIELKQLDQQISTQQDHDKGITKFTATYQIK